MSSSSLNKIERVTPEERPALARGDVRMRSQYRPLLAKGWSGTAVGRGGLRAASEPVSLPEEDVQHAVAALLSLRNSSAKTALDQLDEEVPYSVACEIEEFREDRTPVYIRATIYVERDSQKRNPHRGERRTRIRDIGRAARTKIERLVGGRGYIWTSG
jgi:hypothetical protein